MYIHKLLQLYERNVDVFVAPSRFLQQKMLEYGIRNEVHFLPNFINIDEFIPCYEPSNYFVYAGRLVDIKGVPTLLRALRELPSAHLYIIGEGEIEPALRDQARQYGLEHVTFTGHLSTAELLPLVQRAAFMVFPSEWYENCPMTVLESFACGTPVIGARIGGTTELIDDRRTGLLFEPGNAQELVSKIRFMLDRPEQAIIMGQNARRQVEAFNSPTHHYQQIFALYER
jgi:glycosyltransferase involved in cell wall biosynthesis